MMSIVLYTMPDCVQCDATKKYLDKDNVKYSVVDISTNKEAYELVSSLGYKQAPVVVKGDVHWSGFRPDKIASLRLTKEETQ
jgi:glutaredoxin-like protein NrdH